jgi:hypothetical protein
VIPSKYVTFYDDGSATIERMPLAGNFAWTGDGAAINATITGILSADLDPTLSRPITVHWSQLRRYEAKMS